MVQADKLPLSTLVEQRLTEMRSSAENLAPRIEYDAFKAQLVWNQGQHAAFIGPTDSGKTTLALDLLFSHRHYVVIFATKPRDRTFEGLTKQGYRIIEKWERASHHIHPKRVLWPNAGDLHTMARTQRREFAKALADIYADGGWCVYFDEMWYLIHHLKMEHYVKTYLLQARAMDITVVAATQRPAFVPLEIYDQSRHLFFWQDNDERNLKRISGIAWLNAKSVQHLVATLRAHEVLYINTRDRVSDADGNEVVKMYRFTPPAPTADRKGP